MFRFHSRSRSLIPVKDLEKTERILISEKNAHIGQESGEEEEDVEPQTAAQRRNLTMIYLLFLAEAIMSSSLSSQINILLPSTSACLSMNTSFLRSILQCAYYFGSACGIMWGLVADRLGRKKVALVGLFGMSTCCISMGFATSFTAFCLLRCLAGAIGAAVTVSALAMLADSTHGSGSRRIKTVARLPVIAVCGQLGPLLANWIRKSAQENFEGIFVRFPGLGGQIACGALVLSITLAQVLLLDETLPGSTEETVEEEYVDCEKAAFLGQRQSTDSNDSLAISIIDALNDDSATPRPSKISIGQMLTAPSVLLLLASYSVLSLHSSTFEVILPHIAHTDTNNGGMGLPCSWLQPVMLVVKIIAALRVMHFVPFLVSKIGLLPMYRRISTVFPALYVVIPAVALTVNATGASALLSALVSTLATLAKTTLAGAAQVLVLLLVLSAAPDASSTGTLIGVVSISELFKALAVGLTGISYFLSDDYSMLVVNGSLWAALAFIAIVGAFITRTLRETPRLGADLPASCFVWQGMFDAESDEEVGF
ncbi:major facilitator superfamily transporter like [Lecanosticta acicola]|uniref:Major facilitator superfamily transporter like n=1 Tax=Lecanosticta acicola TaxID=111012 RepID=A0AAI9EBZ5_9PEZI|nr:major facilitator superfamily transporter like [Lecanosticta acicola]